MRRNDLKPKMPRRIFGAQIPISELEYSGRGDFRGERPFGDRAMPTQTESPCSAIRMATADGGKHIESDADKFLS